jgi:4-amino-4-deoxychorismate lyase
VTVLALAVSGRGLVDPTEPVIRADDDALLRGRGAFETLRVYGGRPFELDAHLERLTGSAERIGLPPVARGELEGLVELALGAAGAPDAALRLFWTPGPAGGPPTGLALVSEIPAWIEEMRARGARIVTLLGPRAEVPWLLPGTKSTSYAVNIAAEAEARRRDADDAVFVDTDGVVLEGPVTNVWWRAGRILYTPSLDLGILAGVTRKTLLHLAGELGHPVEEGAYDVSRLRAADEVFTSSSVREVMPVAVVDDREIGPGSAASALQAALRRAATSGGPARPA